MGGGIIFNTLPLLPPPLGKAVGTVRRPPRRARHVGHVVPYPAHTATNRARRQSSELWVRAMVPLVAPEKRQAKQPTWRGSKALGGASHETRSSQPSAVGDVGGECEREKVKSVYNFDTFDINSVQSHSSAVPDLHCHERMQGD